MKKITILTLAILAAVMCANAQSSMNVRSSANDILSHIKALHAPDKRQAVFTLQAHLNNDGALVVSGQTSQPQVRDLAVEQLQQAGIEFIDSITVLPTDKWALVRIPAASLRTGGRHAAEMATQAVLGTPVRVLEDKAEFWRVQTPDGYIAYVPSSSLVAKTPAQMAAWRSADRYVVSDPYQIRVYRTAEANGLRDVVTDLVNGCIVEAVPGNTEIVNGRVCVLLPDGRSGWIDRNSLTDAREWAAQDFDPEKILDIAYSMEGTPYLWGGTSTKALDCSGLAKVSYLSNGIILMRDASQQALTGTRIEAADWRNCQPGDLLFFGTRAGKVTHVAIYDHDGNYVHSSGRVKRNSVDPESPAYLTTPFLHAVRIAGNEGTHGIVLARNHPWYF